MRPLVISVIILTSFISSSAIAFPLKHWGVKIGYTSARQKWEHEVISNDQISMRAGFHAGLFTEWFDYNNLSLTTGINYEQKGTSYTAISYDDFGRNLGEQTLSSRLDYLSIPILAKYTIQLGEKSVYILAGPRFDIFLGYAKDEGNLVWGNEDQYKDVVFGISVGFGLARTIFESREIFVEFIYNYDPFWLFESKYKLFTPMESEYRVKNESFNVSLGIGL